MKNFFIIFFIVLLVLTFFSARLLITGPEKQVLIPFGASGHQVAAILKQEGIIRQELPFKILLKIMGWEKDLKNGIYLLRPGTPFWEVIKKIKDGRAMGIKVTIPEGFNLEEIAARFEQTLGIPKNEFLKAAAAGNFNQKFTFLPADGRRTLEGYLFPDTYYFKSFGLTPQAVITPMLKRFEELVLPLWGGYQGRLKTKNMDWNLFQVLTLASVVEKEDIAGDERPVISGVFWNRLKKGLPLESCATINYILKKSQLVLTYQDLKVRSPYNTYLHVGLPPGPICNPGLASIKAALEPNNHKFLYFVAAEDGHHVFSRTFAEHVRSQNKYLKTNLRKQNPAD